MAREWLRLDIEMRASLILEPGIEEVDSSKPASNTTKRTKENKTQPKAAQAYLEGPTVFSAGQR
jgi:hypothetical protein